MINAIAEDIEDSIYEMSTFEKVDLAMASMVIPVPPSSMLTNALMANISEDDVVRACYELILKTDHFDIYLENDEEEITNTDLGMEIIFACLKRIVGTRGTLGDVVRPPVTKKQFRETFNKIQTQLREDSNCCPCSESCELDIGMSYN